MYKALAAALLVSASPALAQSSAFLDAARDAYTAAWDVSPLIIENAAFVTRPAEIVGDFELRETSEFAAGEPLLIYAEPKAYGYLDGENGKEFGVILDVEVLTSEGTSLLSQEEFQTIRLNSQTEVREMFLNITLNLTGFQSGEYQVVIRVHDLASEESAEFALPFSVAG
ncbi:hypothetical protein [Algicella marina]|uniref:Uncharacterized protein n=1 Tax=Algicella marina TaxID=2683284 RepID=A0A6P1SZ55_9RHOB|nr:hypothetical protein [Algicella marina]QHQ34900.1 hypothetical protein GO499_06635 [Algicella marina]